MYYSLRIFLFILLIFKLNTCSNIQNTNIINIAVASNMQFAIKAIAERFSEKTGAKCHLIISSSGKLTAQIKSGAPYDIFIAANMKYPNEIATHELSIFPPKGYAYGQLVLWTTKENLIPSIHVLNTNSVQHIAMANPKTAPYGAATIDFLKQFQLLDTLNHKFVYGESISQVNQFILSQAAEIGFTAKSVVLASHLKQKGNWLEVEQKYYPKIEQGVVLIRQKRVKKEAEKFYHFLFSKEAQQILKDFGYSLVES